MRLKQKDFLGEGISGLFWKIRWVFRKKKIFKSLRVINLQWNVYQMTLFKNVFSTSIVKFFCKRHKIIKCWKNWKKKEIGFFEKKSFSSFWKASSTKLEGVKNASGSRPFFFQILHTKLNAINITRLIKEIWRKSTLHRKWRHEKC